MVSTVEPPWIGKERKTPVKGRITLDHDVIDFIGRSRGEPHPPPLPLIKLDWIRYGIFCTPYAHSCTELYYFAALLRTRHAVGWVLTPTHRASSCTALLYLPLLLLLDLVVVGQAHIASQFTPHVAARANPPPSPSHSHSQCHNHIALAKSHRPHITVQQPPLSSAAASPPPPAIQSHCVTHTHTRHVHVHMHVHVCVHVCVHVHVQWTTQSSAPYTATLHCPRHLTLSSAPYTVLIILFSASYARASLLCSALKCTVSFYLIHWFICRASLVC